MKTKMWGKKLLGALETKVSCLRTFINKVENNYNFIFTPTYIDILYFTINKLKCS
jgi:hypothetical protein